jgi:hypothetical protein
MISGRTPRMTTIDHPDNGYALLRCLEHTEKRGPGQARRECVSIVRQGGAKLSAGSCDAAAFLESSGSRQVPFGEHPLETLHLRFRWLFELRTVKAELIDRIPWN